MIQGELSEKGQICPFSGNQDYRADHHGSGLSYHMRSSCQDLGVKKPKNMIGNQSINQ